MIFFPTTALEAQVWDFEKFSTHEIVEEHNMAEVYFYSEADSIHISMSFTSTRLISPEATLGRLLAAESNDEARSLHVDTSKYVNKSQRHFSNIKKANIGDLIFRPLVKIYFEDASSDSAAYIKYQIVDRMNGRGYHSVVNFLKQKGQWLINNTPSIELLPRMLQAFTPEALRALIDPTESTNHPFYKYLYQNGFTQGSLNVSQLMKLLEEFTKNESSIEIKLERDGILSPVTFPL